jgi:hypothetical protein
MILLSASLYLATILTEVSRIINLGVVEILCFRTLSIVLFYLKHHPVYISKQHFED